MELALRGGGAHGDDALSAPDCLNDIDGIDPGPDGAEGAVMDTMAAMDAFFVVDHADAVIGIGDGVDGAGFFAGALHMHNGAVGTGFGTQAAGFAFDGVDAHAGIAGGNGIETAGIQAGLAEAEAADIRDQVFLDRAVIAGGGNDGDHIAGGTAGIRVLPQGEADAPPDNFALLIDSAAVIRLRARNDGVDQVLAVFGRQLILPGQAADFLQDLML